MQMCALSAGTRHIEICNLNHHSLWRHPDRTMPVHDLIYMLEGEWEICEEDNVFNIKAGDLLLLGAGRHHFGKKPCSEHVKTLYFHIFPQPGDEFGMDINADSTFVFPQKLTIPPYSQIPSLLEQSVKSYWDRTIFSNVRADAYLSLALCEISALTKDAIFLSKERMMERLLSTLKYSPQRFFSVEEMSRMLNVCPKTLYNYFLETTGQSPHQYQISTKLEQARALLEEAPNMKLKEISARYGFSDEYHFSKLFKNKFGYSPKFRH